MNVVGRQKYGLGSFVKKAFGKAKDVVSDVVKSPIGKAALIAAGGYYLGGGNLFGLQRAGMSGFGMGNLPGIGGMFAKSGAAPFTNRFAQDLGMKQSTGILSSILGASKSNIAKVVGAGGLLGYFTSKGIAPEEAEQLSQDVYRGKGAGLDMIKADMEKYKSGESSESELFAKGYNFLPQKKFIRQGSADGGRIGLQSGGVSMSNTRAQNIAANQAQNQENQQMLEIGRARLPGARTAVQDYAMSDNSILGPLSKQAASTIMENQDKSQAALDVLNQTMTPTTDTGIMTQAPTISTPTPSVEKTTMADVAGPIQDLKRENLYLKDIGIDGINDESPLNILQKYLNFNKNIKNNTVLNEYGEGARSGNLPDYVDPYAEGFNLEKDYFNSPNNLRRLAIDYDPRSGKLAYYDKNEGPYGAYKYYSGDLVDQDFVNSFGLKRFDPKDSSTFTTPQAYGLASGGRAGYDMGGLSTIERAKALFEERDEAAPAPSPDMGSIKQLSNEDKAIMQQAIEAMSRDVGPMYSDPDGNEMTSKQFQDAMSRITELENMTMPKRKPSKSKGGMMSIPVRQNSGGITELDYRKSGGFVPVGIKEKADDVPAMLSKNEFVMTADAVRAAGGGSIEKGAQRMYNQMKQLEGKMA
jgi:hypothetical protein